MRLLFVALNERNEQSGAVALRAQSSSLSADVWACGASWELQQRRLRSLACVSAAIFTNGLFEGVRSDSSGKVGLSSGDTHTHTQVCEAALRLLTWLAPPRARCSAPGTSR